MVALSLELLRSLEDVVADLKEAVEANIWSVIEALALNDSFTRNGIPRAALVRAIVVDQFSVAARRHGLNVQPGAGGSVEVQEISGQDMAIIRLKSAEIVTDEYRVLANSNSTFTVVDDGGFWLEKHYVLGFIVTETTMEFFVAEVVGQTEARVASFVFGWIHRFENPTTFDGPAFKPSDGDDLGDWDAAGSAALDELA